MLWSISIYGATEALMDAQKQNAEIHNLISSRSIEGTTVFSLEGKRLGSIDFLYLDTQLGNVRYAVVEFDGLLGFGCARHPVPWTLLKFDQVFDGYVVPFDKQTVKRAPSFESHAHPEFTPEFERLIFQHYVN